MKTLIILAGGKSSRMGQDKVMLRFDGMTFIEHIYARARLTFERIIISVESAEHEAMIKELPEIRIKSGARFCCPEFVIDAYEECGPMGGLVSVFEKTDVDRFSVISTDVPFADMEVLETLWGCCSGCACFLKIGDKKAEPLIAAYDRKAYPYLKENLEKRLLKLRMAFPKEKVNVLNENDLASMGLKSTKEDLENSFRNFNTPEEFAGLCR